MANEYGYEEYQFPEEHADAIIRTTSYHRKDFDLAVISFPDSEHQDIRTSISTSFPRPSSTSLEPIGQLPQELLNNIFLSLDIQSLINCRQVNLRLREAIDFLPEYQAVSTHGLDALCALLRTRLAHNVSLVDFYEALCTKKCSFCYRFAGYMSLPTWRRCCFICLKLRDTEFQMLTLDGLQKQFGLSEAEVSKFTSFVTLPGVYTTTHAVERERLTIAPVEQAMRAYQENQKALQETARSWFPKYPKFAFMATCVLPYYDKQNRTADYGICCAGEQRAIDNSNQRGMALKFAYMARDIVYPRDEFLEHFKECREGQQLWESSKEGTIEPPELPQIAKDGGVFDRE
ncbi:hypothetical protein VE03_06036 [Pseudogymnoascus sp. 23342-1-I1]|nr:hypothetical protein VE03_06036 [Pseudogymnoascus sp. 23342-1-I1]